MNAAAPRYTLADLVALMARLRDPQYGCPWDLKQDFATIAPYTVEEAHEVADAIARDDMAGLRGELGDLLFQVVFHAQMARERRLFDVDDVVHGLVEKMLRRHPHVFPDGRVDGERRRHDEHDIGDIKSNWEATKTREKQAAGESAASAVDGVPAGFPALVRAQKLQKKAARVGFDWPDTAGVVDKVREETAELAAALRSGNRGHVGEEIGDLLFTLVNLARKEGFDAEALTRAANLKFEARFRLMEEILAVRGTPVGEAGPATMDAAWHEAKKRLATPDGGSS
ncbi:MAG: nucleoside triphosphate pyrophosphohydrolase [Pseudomonadota bacterium]